MKVPTQSPIYKTLAALNPLKPRNQLMVIGAMLAMGAPSGAYVGTTVQSLKMTGRGASFYRKTIGPVTTIANIAGSVEAMYKIRRGGYKPAMQVTYVPMDPAMVPPAPHIGSIPVVQLRMELGAEKIQSRGGRDRITTRTALKGRKSIRRPSAKRRKKTRTRRFRRDEERYRGRR